MDSLETALVSLKLQKMSNVRDTSRKFGIVESTFRRKFKGNSDIAQLSLQWLDCIVCKANDRVISASHIIELDEELDESLYVSESPVIC